MFESNGKGILISYTHFPECSVNKNWILVSGERIREAKRIIELDDPFYLADAFSSDKTDRYLKCGVVIEFREASAPTLKDGWSIRLRCGKARKENLEETLKHLKLFDEKINRDIQALQIQ